MAGTSRAAIVLCIDDEVLGLEIRRAVLEREGYSVLTANDGATGIALFRDNTVDAVVLDYAMPGMNGGEVARALRSIEPQTKILLLSAYLALPPEVVRLVNMVVNKGDGALPLLDKLRVLLGAEGQGS
jgi:CheY-like chemotaxis protein